MFIGPAHFYDEPVDRLAARPNRFQRKFPFAMHAKAIATLKDLDTVPVPITRHSIISAVSLVTGVTVEEMKSPSRMLRHVRARMMYYYLARTRTKASYLQIAFTICRDHSTVINGIRAFERHRAVLMPMIRTCEVILEGSKAKEESGVCK